MTEPRAPCAAPASPRVVALVALTVDGPATLATVDALARLALAVRRVGLDLRLVDDEPELRALLRLTGLDEVVAGSVVESRREAEPGEQAGVEEVVEVADPPA